MHSAHARLILLAHAFVIVVKTKGNTVVKGAFLFWNQRATKMMVETHYYLIIATVGENFCPIRLPPPSCPSLRHLQPQHMRTTIR